MSVRVSNPESVVRSWPTENARLWVRRFVYRAARDANILAVIAVGSAIRVTADADDLDLVIICERRGSVPPKSPIEVDVAVFEAPEADQSLSERHPLLGWAVKFGKPLLDERVLGRRS